MIESPVVPWGIAEFPHMAAEISIQVVMYLLDGAKPEPIKVL